MKLILTIQSHLYLDNGRFVLQNLMGYALYVITRSSFHLWCQFLWHPAASDLFGLMFICQNIACSDADCSQILLKILVTL